MPFALRPQRPLAIASWFPALLTTVLVAGLSHAQAPLRMSVYATAGDVARHLGSNPDRDRVARLLQPLQVSRLFLEGRRGDEYVAPALLKEVRDFFTTRGIECSGGIATVPGQDFATRQNGGLGWLNWENPRTRRDVAWFFTENAPVFDSLIVDDFYCTADTSPRSESARGQRPWSQYRRDLLVSLIEPLIRQPAIAARPDIRLIIKFPQWYDRFHLFGYDPARMGPAFHEVWVGTEVRNPATRRMGYVQPTEGFVNFRWIQSLLGSRVVGAWFDHIECTPENFLDQAVQSVLGGARELTLFRLGDVLDQHPGDALLAARLPELSHLASNVCHRKLSGIAFYKPPSSDGDENLYLMDYLVMLGLPLVPSAQFPMQNPVVFLGAQAADDPHILRTARAYLRQGGHLVLTPAFIRKVGTDAAQLAGVNVGPVPLPQSASTAHVASTPLVLTSGLEFDAAVQLKSARAQIQVASGDQLFPLLTRRRDGKGWVYLLNIRTFGEADFTNSGEWLLAPRPSGWPHMPQRLANALRAALLRPLNLHFEAPPGVALYLLDDQRCLYSFLDAPAFVRLGKETFTLPAHGILWLPNKR